MSVEVYAVCTRCGLRTRVTWGLFLGTRHPMSMCCVAKAEWQLVDEEGDV